MTDKEFVEKRYELKDEEVVAYNKELCKQFPFLAYRDDTNFLGTWLDQMPDGWRIAFGIQMCEELKEELLKYDYLNEYTITEIKEKYGELRWYDGGSPKDSQIYDIIEKYSKLSEETCIVCGRPATCYTTGWISPYCRTCVGDMAHKNF